MPIEIDKWTSDKLNEVEIFFVVSVVSRWQLSRGMETVKFINVQMNKNKNDN